MEQRIRIAAAVLACGWIAATAAAQTVEFKVTWTTIGAVVSSGDPGAAALQRDTRIASVAVQPTIVELAVGKELCVSSLQVRTFGAESKPVAGVRLQIAVRKDQVPALQLTRSKGICVRPARSGEYPIRFTSEVPAADDTLRGAQIFVRVR
jgi:hypothetical protein